MGNQFVCDITKGLGDNEQTVYGFRITSPALDRDKEVLDPAGMDAANFLKNPVILWGHDMDEVVGKAVNLRRTAEGWEADIVFADAVSEKAREVKALVDGGFVSATSVRFRPLETEEGRRGVDPYYRKYTRWELLEVSLVSVPANPEALRVKSGRVLNGRNFTRLQQVKDLLDQIFRECERPDDDDEPEDTQPAEGGKTAQGLTIGGLKIVNGE